MYWFKSRRSLIVHACGGIFTAFSRNVLGIKSPFGRSMTDDTITPGYSLSRFLKAGVVRSGVGGLLLLAKGPVALRSVPWHMEHLCKKRFFPLALSAKDSGV